MKQDLTKEITQINEIKNSKYKLNKGFKQLDVSTRQSKDETN